MKQKNYLLCVALLAACSAPANSEEPKKDKPTATPRAEPAGAESQSASKPAQDEGIIPPPKEQIMTKVTLAEVEKNLYVSFGGTYFRLWGGAPTGSQPKGTTVSPDGTKVYTTNFGQDGSKNVYRYDPETLALKAKANFKGNAIESIVTSDNKKIYISNFDFKQMLELDADTLVIKRTFTVESVPKHFAISPDEQTLYVSNWGSGTVSFLDLKTGKIRATVKVGVNPRGTQVTRDGKTLYVANFTSDYLSVIDTETAKEIKQIKTDKIPRHLAVTNDGAFVFVSCYGAEKVQQIDTSKGEVVRTFNVGRGPKTIELSKDEKFFYTADYKGNSMSIGNIETGEVLVLPIPTVKSSGLAVSPDDRRIYVTGWDSINLLVFERLLPGDTPTKLGPKAPGAICYRPTKKECTTYP